MKSAAEMAEAAMIIERMEQARAALGRMIDLLRRGGPASSRLIAASRKVMGSIDPRP